MLIFIHAAAAAVGGWGRAAICSATCRDILLNSEHLHFSPEVITRPQGEHVIVLLRSLLQMYFLPALSARQQPGSTGGRVLPRLRRFTYNVTLAVLLRPKILDFFSDKVEQRNKFVFEQILSLHKISYPDNVINSTSRPSRSTPHTHTPANSGKYEDVFRSNPRAALCRNGRCGLFRGEVQHVSS